MSALQNLLTSYRQVSLTEREKGTYFEELILTYLRNEATYRDLYSDVWTYSDWSNEQGLDKRDTGIDLVARTQGTNEFHAIQCKFYAEDYRIQKADIDSFFTEQRSVSNIRELTSRVSSQDIPKYLDNLEVKFRAEFDQAEGKYITRWQEGDTRAKSDSVLSKISSVCSSDRK